MQDHGTDTLNSEADTYHVMFIIDEPDAFSFKIFGLWVAAERDRRQQARCAFFPDQVFVIFVLIH